MKNFVKMSLNVVVLSAVLFVGIAIFVAMSTKSMMVGEAERTVRSVVRATAGRIDLLMSEVESAVNNSAWMVGEHLSDPDYMYRITRELVKNNEFIVGSAIAFKSNYFPKKGHFFAPYSYLDEKDALKSKQLGTADNDYFVQEWYDVPVKSGERYWTEPYFDEGGGKILMSTYSVPIKDAKGEVYAVLTADLSLEQLRGYVAAIKPYPQSYAVLKTAKDGYLVRPPRQSEVDKMITIRDHAANGWIIEIICPVSEILRGAEELVVKIVIFSLAGLALIFLLSWFYSSRLQRATVERQRIASELSIASKIQEDILPRKFPDYLTARLRPAREVGGDLYDFVEAGDKVYFIVGDASGKGVPAALFSFMAETAFRLSCTMGLKPDAIVRNINSILVNGNDMSMFVTTFVGLLDRKTGAFEYCNGGHNSPVVVDKDGKVEFLAVKRNLPCGVMEGYPFTLQSARLSAGSTLIVYTDGVTEAERADHSQFGEGRLDDFALAHAAEEPSAIAHELFAEVDRFVAGAEQSDDITVMAIRV